MLNKSPIKKMKNVTPDEAWSGHKPLVHHFQIFGFVCHKHIPDEKRNKLDDKSDTSVLVRYHPIGAYKLFIESSDHK